MAHEIDMTTGTAAVFVTGEPAWHRLGKVIESASTSTEAIQLAGLDWRVEQFPVRAFNPDTDEQFGCPGTVANVRTDTKSVLGVVSSGYHVFQNAEAFDFMDSLVGDKLAMYETAGSLRGGRRIWMLARIPREHRAGPEDLIKPYVLLVNSHDGSSALRMIPTTVRVVCANTLSLALGQAGAEGLAIRHHPSLEKRVAEARQKLGIISARFDRFDQELHAMLATMPTSRQTNDYFQTLIPEATTDREKKNRDAVIGTFYSNYDNERNVLPGMKHTAWALYNAVSEWADHQRRVRGKGDLARVENRLNSNWFGTSHRIKQAAYYSALELAGLN
jgi:phage/plasmid-like protein (TIGR03299 family)